METTTVEDSQFTSVNANSVKTKTQKFIIKLPSTRKGTKANGTSSRRTRANTSERTESEDDEVEDTGSEPSRANSKKRSAPSEDSSSEAESPPRRPTKLRKSNSSRAIATREGTTSERPADATLDTPWQCANHSCNSGQTWHHRDSTGSPHSAYGRKVISNFFGRNKKETGYIHNDVWHTYCRKCYQRETYKVKNKPKASCKFYLDNLDAQFERLELWRPDATFKVQITTGAQKRLDMYYRELNKNGGDGAAAAATVTKTPATNKKGKDVPLSLEEAFSIDKLEEFNNSHSAEGCDYQTCLTVLKWVTDAVENDEIQTMPPMEFLISEKADDEKVNDPTNNYDDWVALQQSKDAIQQSKDAKR
jgi:hypothetical protein